MKSDAARVTAGHVFRLFACHILFPRHNPANSASGPVRSSLQALPHILAVTEL
jgi:hypothetical protein